MKTYQVELPTDIGLEFEASGLTDNGAIAEWVADAIRQKLSAEKKLRYLEARAERGNRTEYRKVLTKVPAIEPAAEDLRTSSSS